MIGRTNAMALVGQVLASSPKTDTTSISANIIVGNSTHLFIASPGSYKISKILKSDMSIATNITVGGTITTLLVQGDYLYYSVTNTLYRVAISDLSAVDNTASYGGNISSITTDGTYIYIVGATTRKIRKYALTDLTTLVAESSAESYDIRNITYDNGNVFIYVRTTSYIERIRKYDVATLTYQADGISYGTTDYPQGGFIVDNAYIYYVQTSGILHKVDTTSLTTESTLTLSGDGKLGSTFNININNGMIYIVGYSEAPSSVFYAKCTTALTGESARINKYPIEISGRAIFADNDYIYIGYAGTDSILKIAKE